jgi:hypothetical protein
MTGIVLLLATLCPAAAAPPPYDARVNSHSLMLPFSTVDPSIGRLVPYISADSGRTWEQLASRPVAAGEACQVEFQVARDGLYWFAVQTVCRDGSKRPADARGLVPCCRFWVDTSVSLPVVPPGVSLPAVEAVAPAAPKEPAEAARLTLSQAVARAEQLGLGNVIKAEAQDGGDVFRLELGDGTVVKIDRAIPNRPADGPAAQLAAAQKECDLGKHGRALEMFEAIAASAADPRDQAEAIAGVARLHGQYARFQDFDRTIERLQKVLAKLSADQRRVWERWIESTKASLAPHREWRFPPEAARKTSVPVIDK